MKKLLPDEQRLRLAFDAEVSSRPPFEAELEVASRSSPETRPRMNTNLPLKHLHLLLLLLMPVVPLSVLNVDAIVDVMF